MSKTITKSAAVQAELNGHSTNGASKKRTAPAAPDETPRSAKAERLPVMKTYKIFIGGKFPRTESGRGVDQERRCQHCQYADGDEPLGVLRR